MKRKIALRFTLLILVFEVGFMVNASAQRTMAGQGYISADCLYDFENFGAKAEYGQYTLGGFWSVGASGHFYDATTTSKYSLEYVHCNAFGGYMHRLVCTRRRSGNLYGGGGVFIGAEVLDPINRLPKDTILGANRARFLYGVYVGLSAELFIVEKLAVTVNAIAPLNFSSGIRMLNYDVGLGLKVML